MKEECVKFFRITRILMFYVPLKRQGQIFEQMLEGDVPNVDNFFGFPVHKLRADRRLNALHYYYNHMGGKLSFEQRESIILNNKPKPKYVSHEQIEEIFNILFMLKAKLEDLPTKEFKPEIKIVIPEDLPGDELDDFIRNELIRLGVVKPKI